MMKPQPILGWILLSTAPLVAQGPPGEAEAPGGGNRPPMAPLGEFIRKADINGDGKVSREEFDQLDRIASLPEDKREKLFGRLDRNGDGVIEGEELNLPPHGFRGRGPMPDLKELDENQDGAISYEEFSKGRFIARLPEEKRKKFFERLDRDQDGLLTPKDHDPEEGLRWLFGKIDENHDGVLDFEEFSKLPWLARMGEDAREDEFEKLDTNGDLKIDLEELKKGGQGRMKRGGKGRPMGPPAGPHGGPDAPTPPMDEGGGEEMPPPPAEEME
ncbi:Ca2+-binding EF-hand superfamily protein [Haloferula luteola]|uniref:Ca2+-binding EF-hand superfamily protein n=1 Tax=Haloferula luteola TaxID=595692 RepID=A0A840VEE0_9BACT|nr:EF-hand domain-containing protein [Haloferula luteola]MBB5352230.1 Ca2+-binding EF-hand superfamily protein [Haloferula luteola]